MNEQIMPDIKQVKNVSELLYAMAEVRFLFRDKWGNFETFCLLIWGLCFLYDMPFPSSKPPNMLLPALLQIHGRFFPNFEISKMKIETYTQDTFLTFKEFTGAPKQMIILKTCMNSTIYQVPQG